MSKRVCGVAIAAVVGSTLALAGCGGSPDGADGDLVGDWSGLPEPVQVVPEAGTCHDHSYSDAVRLTDDDTVACTEAHYLETVHVGAFEGEAADRGSPPNQGTGQWRTAYRECDERATEYLAADFRSGRLWLGVVVPTQAAWRGGARWFRCDIQQLSQFDNLTHATESLRGVFEAEPELALGCFTGRSEEVEGSGFFSIEDLAGASCDEPHQAEFVGVWHAEEDAGFPRTDTARDRIRMGCLERVAAYVDVPVSADLLFRLGVAWRGMSEPEWDNGDHGFRCLLWVPDDRLTGSLEAAGPDGLPTR